MSEEDTADDEWKTIIWIIIGLLVRLGFAFYSLTTKVPVQAGRDGGNYINIARGGYTDWNIVFPPMYPLTIKLFSFIFSYEFSAYFITILSACIAQYFFVKIVEIEDLMDSEYSVDLASFVFIFGNFAWLHMSSVPSTEGPAMMFMLGAMYFAKTRYFLPSAVFLFFGSLTRTTFVLFFPYFAYLFFKSRNKIWDVIYAIPAGAGYIIHSLIGYYLFDDLFIISKTQREWGTFLVYPLYPLRHLYYLNNLKMGIPQSIGLIFVVISLFYYYRVGKAHYSLQGIFLVIFLLSLSPWAFWSYGFARQSIYVIVYYYLILEVLSNVKSHEKYDWLFPILVSVLLIFSVALTIIHINWMGNL